MSIIEGSHEASRRFKYPVLIVSVAVFFLICPFGSQSILCQAEVPSYCAFGSNGNVIAFGITSFERPAELRIADIKTGRELSQVKFNQPYMIVVAVAISPNERYVASSAFGADGSGEWFVFDRNTNQISKHFPRRQEAAAGLVFNHDSTLLATSALTENQAAIHVRRVVDGKTVAKYDLTKELKETEQMVSQLAFSPKKSILAFAFYDPDPPKAGDLVFWDWKTNQIRRKATKLSYPVSRVVFSPDGEFFITGGGPDFRARMPTGPSEIVVWNPDGKQITNLQGLSGEVRSLCFSADGDRFAASGYDLGNPMKIVTWQSKGWKQDKPLIANKPSASQGLHFRDDNSLLSASSDGIIREWDLPNSRLVGSTDYWKEN